MKENENKEHIIKNIRKALLNRKTMEETLHDGNISISKFSREDDLPIVFVENFIKAGGKLLYCTSEEEIKVQLNSVISLYSKQEVCCCSQNLTHFFNNLGLSNIHHPASLNTPCEIGIMPCESLLAWNGSVVISNGQGIMQLPKILILFAFSTQVVADWKEASIRLKEQYNYDIPNQVVLLQPKNQHFKKIYLLLAEDQ